MSAVEIACVCPGTPHERDTVNLRDVMDFVHGKALRYRVQLLEDAERADSALVLATLTEGYLLYGIESWTLVDADGKPLPVSPDTIRGSLLSHAVEADELADRAAEMYGEAVMSPLLQRAQNSSPPTPTEESTSASSNGETRTADSEPRPLKPSKRSSTFTTPMEGIVEISA